MELQSNKEQLSSIWKKYKLALTRLDWALGELAKRPVQQPTQRTIQQPAQIEPLYKPAKTQSPTDSTTFTIDGNPTEIRDMKPDDVHKLFNDGILPKDYMDMIQIEIQGQHITSKAVKDRGTSRQKLHEPKSLQAQYPGILSKLTPDADNKMAVKAQATFGSKYPGNPNKGDVFLRVDTLPTKLFKFNGNKWIELDKNNNSSYTYNDEYIKYLASVLESGQYDPELLSDSERDALDDFIKDNNGK